MGLRVGDKVKVIKMVRPSTSFEIGETGKIVGIYEYCNNYPISVRMDKDKEVIDFSKEELKLYKEEDKLVKFNVEDKVLVKGGNGEARIVRKWILTREGIEFYLDSSSRPYKESELELYKEDKMEKTFQEVIRDIKEGEVWESENNSCDIRVTRTKTGISIRDFNDNAIVWFDDDFRFKLKRKEYTFQEAFAAYEKGKEIQSAVTGIKCQKRRLPYETEVKDYCYYSDDLKEFAELKEFTISEIKGLWYINELR